MAIGLGPRCAHGPGRRRRRLGGIQSISCLFVFRLLHTLYNYSYMYLCVRRADKIFGSNPKEDGTFGTRCEIRGEYNALKGSGAYISIYICSR